MTSTFASGRANSTNGTLVEIACAPSGNCNTDQLAFRAILARALAQTRALVTSLPLNASSIANITSSSAAQSQAAAAAAAAASELQAQIDFILRTSAKGAAAQCSGGEKGTVCGNDWSSGEWDGTSGLGQDLSALNVIVANLQGGGRLATANASATETGDNATATDGSTGSGTGNGTGSSAGATTDSASSASHVALSSMVLAVVAVGLTMVLL